jgi:hypothetical protein
VPVLARTIESAGIPTVTVTMMPDVAAKYRLSRLVGVEFPFGHAFGMPNDPGMQLAVARAAVDLLDSATEPESRLDVEIEWPIDTKVAYRDWQPAEPSPIVAYNIARRAAIEERRER